VFRSQAVTDVDLKSLLYRLLVNQFPKLLSAIGKIDFLAMSIKRKSINYIITIFVIATMKF